MAPRSNPRWRPAEILTLLGTAAVLVVADQVSKALVVANVPVGGQVQVIGDVVQIWHAQNRGAAFSLFQNSFMLFLVVGVLAMGLIGYFAWSLRGRSIWYFVLLGVILAGTLGNLADRIRHELFVGQQYVTDFISVGIGTLRWPTFNVADSCLVVGILVFVVVLLVVDARERAGHEKDPEQGSELP
jgi:signal peptidase II